MTSPHPRDRYLQDSINTASPGTLVVMLYDGVGYHLTEVGGNRINARHSKNTKTNLAFYDGHVDTYVTETLPGGRGVKTPAETQTVFGLANLQANYPPPSPMWILEQQY